MEAPGDKMATTHADPSNTVPHPPAPKRGKHGKPVAVVKFGSASVPVYRCDSGGRVRFAISHYRDGKRLRQFFTTLEAAKKEAQFVARRIQSGIAKVKSADQVALEAGNSPSIIFKHYRELATEEQADQWFSIVPKEGQWENAFKWDHRARVVTLPETSGK